MVDDLEYISTDDNAVWPKTWFAITIEIKKWKMLTVDTPQFTSNIFVKFNTTISH